MKARSRQPVVYSDPTHGGLRFPVYMTRLRCSAAPGHGLAKIWRPHKGHAPKSCCQLRIVQLEVGIKHRSCTNTLALSLLPCALFTHSHACAPFILFRPKLSNSRHAPGRVLDSGHHRRCRLRVVSPDEDSFRFSLRSCLSNCIALFSKKKKKTQRLASCADLSSLSCSDVTDMCNLSRKQKNITKEIKVHPCYSCSSEFPFS